MFEELIEDQGLGPLKEILKQLGGWPVLEGEEWKEENFNWTNIIYQHRQIGFKFFYFMEFLISFDPEYYKKNLKEFALPFRRAFRIILVSKHEFSNFVPCFPILK